MELHYTQLISLVIFTNLLLTFSAGQLSIGSLRLIPNPGSSARDGGRLEVWLNNQWGTVCEGGGFGPEEGGVACQQLGYLGAIGYGTVRKFGFNEAPSDSLIWLDRVVCNGTEERLVDCSHQGVGVTTCNHGNDVALICYGIPVDNPANGTLRLNSGGVQLPRTYSGRLEVYWSGQWGTVCDDGFGRTDADVACRELGFNSALFYDMARDLDVPSAPTTTPIWLTSVNCLANDTRLIDCVNITSVSEVSSCSHFEDIALVCIGTGSLRLINSFDFSSRVTRTGRLEVYFNGTWGTVCLDGFNQSAANVACRQIGESQAYDFGPVSDLGYNPSTEGPDWLSGIHCSNNHSSLLTCSSNWLDLVSCGQQQQVAISCSSTFQRPTDTETGRAVGITIGVLILSAIVITFLASIPYWEKDCICCLCQACKSQWRKLQRHPQRQYGMEPVQESALSQISNYSRAAQEPPAPYSETAAVSTQAVLPHVSDFVQTTSVQDPLSIEATILTQSDSVSTGAEQAVLMDQSHADFPPLDLKLLPKIEPSAVLTSEGPPTYGDVVATL